MRASNPLLPTWLTVGLLALGMLGTMFLSYHKTDLSLTSRVTALEAHQVDDSGKVDHIQAQVDRLVSWALGDPLPKHGE